MIPGSTRVSRVGESVPLSRTWSLVETISKHVSAGRPNQHARRVCSPSLRGLLLIGILALTGSLPAAEVIPPKPDRYFNDYAQIVSSEAALRFNEQLAQFERDTSNQLMVAIFPKMQSNSDVADYTRRVAQAWGVGQKDRRNGAVLFVFPQDRKMFIQVGYGLEGALPDITAFDITEYKIKPHFRNNDYEGGLAAGINSMIAAVRGEYKGSGHTVREKGQVTDTGWSFLIFFFIFIIALIIIGRMNKGHPRRGYRYSSYGGPFVGGWSGGSGGGWSSGGGGGGGFSGFSGGGGSFGGGGAGSSW